MVLELRGLKVDCILGDLPHEREVPQTVTVDADLEIDDLASRTDSLADTVDYAALAGEISRALVDARCRLLERAARIVAGTCLAKECVKAVKIGIRKRNGVPGLDSAGVRLEEKKKI